MKKLLFFDYRELEYVEGFGRAVESPVKDAGAPLLRPELPWEQQPAVGRDLAGKCTNSLPYT